MENFKHNINKLIYDEELKDQLIKQITIKASSLSFYTIMAFIIFSLLVASNSILETYYKQFEVFLLSNIFNINEEVIEKFINLIYANNTSKETISEWTGWTYIFIISILFFQNFETIMRNIYYTPKRTLQEKLMLYWTTITLIPILLPYFTIYFAKHIQNSLDTSGIPINLLYFTPFLTLFFMFWLGYVIGANKKLSFLSLFIPSLVTTSLTYLLKNIVSGYVNFNGTYPTINEILHISIILFIWIYLTWVIFISGAYLSEFLEEQFENAENDEN